jgi:TetR/AcrR family transcriptional regulator, mexJK operon transcriptional repressor
VIRALREDHTRTDDEVADVPLVDNTCCKKRATRGRPRDASKNSAIVSAASKLFLEKGFDSTSMDEVAKRAGVSKQTVYSHFSSKEQLFSSSIHAAIEKYFPDLALEQVTEHSLEAELRAVCENYARLLLSKEALAMFRLLATEAPKGPALAEIFWQSGPQDMEKKLEEFLQLWVDRGDLKINNINKAAHRLITLLKGNAHFMLSIGLLSSISEEEILTTIDEAMEAFLRLYKA